MALLIALQRDCWEVLNLWDVNFLAYESPKPTKLYVRHFTDKQYVWRIGILYQVPGVCFQTLLVRSTLYSPTSLTHQLAYMELHSYIIT